MAMPYMDEIVLMFLLLFVIKSSIEILKRTNKKWKPTKRKISKAQKKKQRGEVYFIYDPDNKRIKIGRSINSKRRLKQFQTANPNLKLLKIIKTNDMNSLEKHYHEKFKEYRREREWFDNKIKRWI
ncbi:MAG: GIY-YIG nuclease family protein [Firmicutes bacterium]|nr:GIY-YIG nuclease family protein [Bacillota bacterium]